MTNTDATRFRLVKTCPRWMAVWWWPLFALILLAVVLVARPSPVSAQGVSIAKSVSPSTVLPNGIVNYTLFVSNTAAAVDNLTVRDVLPPGFSYRDGTSRIYINGILASTANPALTSGSLAWSGSRVRLPPGRSGSIYGIHTFVQTRQDTSYNEYQVGKAVQLVGEGAYVTQLLDYVGASSPGAPAWIKDWVNRAYDARLTPVIRLAGTYGGQYWIKPKPDGDGTYATTAQGVRRVVHDLPRRDGHTLYVQIWNEPNLSEEWEGQPNPVEYGRFLTEVASAIRSLGDIRIRILNAPMSPGSPNYHYLTYLDAMLDNVPSALWAFDVWASHPYPNNHPPDYNIHRGNAAYTFATIDAYQKELQVLADHGRTGLLVLLTETGYALYQADFGFEGYPAIGEANRADYMVRAFRDYWSRWPEVIGVCPFELVDTTGQWWVWDWLYPNGQTHQQFDAVRAMEKVKPVAASVLTLTFSASAASSPGVYADSAYVLSGSTTLAAAIHAAPVTVYAPTATPTRTSTRTPTPTLTPEATQTETPRATPSPTTSPAPTPSQQATPTSTGVGTATATAVTETPVPTLSPTSSLTAAPETPTATVSPTLPPETPIWTPTATRTSTAEPTATRTSTPTPTPSPTSLCTELISNGGFEANGLWQPWSSPYPADYSALMAHTGQRSMRVPGVVAPQLSGYSTVAQSVEVPTGASQVRLGWWHNLTLDGSGGDKALVSVYRVDSLELLVRLATLTQSSAGWVWNEVVVPPLPHAMVRVAFTTVNDGNGQSVWYLDDVTMQGCFVQPTPLATPSVTATPSATATSAVSVTPSPTSTPTGTATATPFATTPAPSPSPTACLELIVDGGFEADDVAWQIPSTAQPAGYSALVAHTGSRSLRLGIEPDQANVSSYSSAWQALTVPADATMPTLRLWYYAVSGDTAHDLQYAMLQDEDGSFVEWILVTHAQDPVWRYHEFALDSYRGQNIRISFGVRNDGLGGSTTLYVDDVSVLACAGPTNLSERVFLPVLLEGVGAGSATVGLQSPGDTLGGPVRQLWATDAGRGPDWLQSVVWDSTRGILYVGAGQQLRFIAEESGVSVAQLDVGATVRGLALDEGSGRVYAALWETGELAVISTEAPRVVQRVPRIPGASGVVVDAAHVYVSATRSDELVVVDKLTLSVVGRVQTGDAPYALACDDGRRIVYVAEAGASTITVVDGQTSRVLRVLDLSSVGAPYGLALDPQQGLLYVTHAYGKYRAVTALDASTGVVVASLLGSRNRPLWGAYGIAVDPLRGWVYLPTVSGTLVLHGQTLGVLREMPEIGPVYAFGWSVDPVRDRLYIVDAERRSVVVSGPSIEGTRGSH